jgi:trans-2,3-dihydro-3-hydroxyanthranilate isomerase
MALSFLHYDVFTDTPLAGNQLAVFLDGRGLSAEKMQAIAKEMNFSESTFILPAVTPGTDGRMRIFTPGNELPIAGHPTVGTTFGLAHAGVIKPGTRRFVFDLAAGPTPVDLVWKGTELASATMTQLNPKFGEPLTDRASAAAAIGLHEEDLLPGKPVQEISCGVPCLYVPLRDRATVDRAAADVAAYRRFATANSLADDGMVYLFTPEEGGAYSRMFAPGFGIPEDPATGIAAGPLGCYLVRHKLASDATRIVNHQGVRMGRASRIDISITEKGGEIVEVKVGGQAVLVGKGELFV